MTLCTVVVQEHDHTQPDEPPKTAEELDVEAPNEGATGDNPEPEDDG